jgi:hypothetical protein
LSFICTLLHALNAKIVDLEFAHESQRPIGSAHDER